jgi:hypothetical protein
MIHSQRIKRLDGHVGTRRGERTNMSKFDGKWERVDLVEHFDRDPHSADANVMETLDLANAACTLGACQERILVSWRVTLRILRAPDRVLPATGRDSRSS